jgi:alanine-glyoxylate transaminase / serine-glyoxylate transaminase / serine-pyruvate transaminase
MIDPRNLPDMPRLMIVGPGELHDDDLAALGQQVIAHYGDTWTQFHDQTVAAVGTLLNASDPPYVIPGSGTTCLDAALLNLFEPGQRVVIAQTGFFGTRLTEVARAQRLEVVEVAVQIGAPADPQALADAADGAAGVLITHVETSTGVRHPIAEIARAAHDRGAICVVDGIASVGGELCDVDGWGLDAVITSTQKGLETPPGLGIIALGAGGRERMRARSERPYSWYLDLATWDWYRENWGTWHPHPVTMPTNLFLALASSLRRILETGLAPWVSERAALAKKLRDGLAALGLEQVPQLGAESNMVVAVYAEDAPAIQKHLLGQGLQISGGLAPLAGRTLRIGLMGATATPAMADRVIEAVALARKETA